MERKSTKRKDPVYENNLKAKVDARMHNLELCMKLLCVPGALTCIPFAFSYLGTLIADKVIAPYMKHKLKIAPFLGLAVNAVYLLYEHPVSDLAGRSPLHILRLAAYYIVISIPTGYVYMLMSLIIIAMFSVLSYIFLMCVTAVTIPLNLPYYLVRWIPRQLARKALLQAHLDVDPSFAVLKAVTDNDVRALFKMEKAEMEAFMSSNPNYRPYGNTDWQEFT